MITVAEGAEPRSLQSRLLFFGLLGLILWAPLPLGSNRPWAAAILEIWVGLLATLWLCGYAVRANDVAPAFRRAWPAVALLVMWLLLLAAQVTPLPAAWVQWVSPQAAAMHALPAVLGEGQARLTLSVDPNATRAFLLKSIAYVCVFALALLVVHDRKRLRQLATVIVFSALLQALYGSLSMLGGFEWDFFGEKKPSRDMATGTFVNRNHFAGYLEMGLAVGIGLLIASLGTEPSHTWRQRLRNVVKLLLSPKIRLRLYLAAMVVALVLSRSRMGNTAFFASLIVAGVIGLVLSRHATRSTVVLLTSLIVIDLLIVGAWFGVDKVAERLQETSVEAESRDEVNQYGMSLVRDYLWVGSGGGSFYAVFPRYRQGDVERFYNHAHNDYLQFAAETGVLGISILGLVVVLSLAAALVAQYRRRDPLMRGMGFATVMGVTALLIHSAVDFNLQIPANAMMFTLLLALGWLALYLDARPPAPRVKRNRAARGEVSQSNKASASTL